MRAMTANKMDVFFTTDVEIWCNSWGNIDGDFPEAFQKYVYGKTDRGDFGLPFLARELREHDLTGVFFVETLFAARFGLEPLEEIVSILKTHGQDIQLHVHPEWADEARKPVIANVEKKRQHLHFYTHEEQSALLKEGRRLLEAAGAEPPVAFRAGSFAMNADTLKAVAESGHKFDCSYNATLFGPSNGVSPELLVAPTLIDQVVEYPMTVFNDGFGMRHVQLTACSYGEIETLLWRALERGDKSFLILCHNFELLDSTKSRRDPFIVRRFEKLCKFLANNRDVFAVRGFGEISQTEHLGQTKELMSSPRWRTVGRYVEQAARRFV